jgi:magnesium chelatase family protein
MQQHQPALAWVLPPHSAEEAALLPNAKVYRAQHLKNVAQAFALPAQSAGVDEENSGWDRLASG